MGTSFRKELKAVNADIRRAAMSDTASSCMLSDSFGAALSFDARRFFFFGFSFTFAAIRGKR